MSSLFGSFGSASRPVAKRKRPKRGQRERTFYVKRCVSEWNKRTLRSHASAHRRATASKIGGVSAEYSICLMNCSLDDVVICNSDAPQTTKDDTCDACGTRPSSVVRYDVVAARRCARCLVHLCDEDKGA